MCIHILYTDTCKNHSTAHYGDNYQVQTTATLNTNNHNQHNLSSAPKCYTAANVCLYDWLCLMCIWSYKSDVCMSILCAYVSLPLGLRPGHCSPTTLNQAIGHKGQKRHKGQLVCGKPQSHPHGRTAKHH